MSKKTSKIDKYTLILIILLIAISVLSYLTYFEGVFEGKSKYLSYEAGNIDTPLSQSPPNDYYMWTNFESRGVFITGRKIHVSIDFQANTDKSKESQIFVVFPGAIEYPLPEGRFSFEKIASPSIELNFVNDSFAHGEKDIVYLTQEQVSESSISPIKTDRGYTYALRINNKWQNSDNSVRLNPILYLAPSEIGLQLKNSTCLAN